MKPGRAFVDTLVGNAAIRPYVGKYNEILKDLKQEQNSARARALTERLKDASRELGREVLKHIDSFIIRADIDYDTFIYHVTTGILVGNFFQSDRATAVNPTDRTDSFFDRIEKYISDNWARFDDNLIAQYINTQNLLIAALATESQPDMVLAASKPTLLNHIFKFDGIDVCVTNSNGRPAISYFKSAKSIALLLQKCRTADKKEELVNMCDANNKSALYHFTYEIPKDYDAISLLINNGANPNIDKTGFIKSARPTDNSLAHQVIIDGQYDLAKTILNNPTTILEIVEMANGKTLLHTAVESNATDIVNIIATKIPATMIDARDNANMTALLYAAQNNRDAKIIKILLDNGANPNLADTDGKTALFFVNDADAFQYLAENPNTDFEHKDIVDKSFIYYIAGNPKLAQKLRDKLTTVQRLFTPNKYHENPLHWVTSAAECENYINILGQQAKSVVCQKNIRGNTPLHWARTPEIAHLLIKAGADVNAKNDSDATPLHWAQDVEIAKVLIANCADINATDNMGKTPVIYAMEQDNKAVQEYLEGHTSDKTRFSIKSFFLKS